MNRIDKSPQSSRGTGGRSSRPLQDGRAVNEPSRGTEHGPLPKAGRRSYETLSIVPLTLSTQSQLLAGSIPNASIKSVGQELGPSFDISAEEDSFTGKDFNLEWNAGN